MENNENATCVNNGEKGKKRESDDTISVTQWVKYEINSIFALWFAVRMEESRVERKLVWQAWRTQVRVTQSYWSCRMWVWEYERQWKWSELEKERERERERENVCMRQTLGEWGKECTDSFELTIATLACLFLSLSLSLQHCEMSLVTGDFYINCTPH